MAGERAKVGKREIAEAHKGTAKESTPAYRAAMACAKAGKPKPGQTVVEMWAEIIVRETACADLLAACEAIQRESSCLSEEEVAEGVLAEISQKTVQLVYDAVSKAKQL